MKKIFSLFAAVLMAGSMMAEQFADSLEFYTVEGFDNIDIVTPGQSSTGGDYEFTKGGTTVTGTFGYIYNKKHTVYKSGKMVITALADIDSVIITYNTNCYPFAEALAGGSTTTKTSAITTTTFIPNDETPTLTFTNASAGKTELRELVVYYSEGGNNGGGGIIEEEETIVGELLCTLDFPSHNDKEISAYTETWTATVDGATWTLTNFNNNKNVWNLVKCGRKGVASVASIETPALKATVNTLIYDFAALPANSVDSAFIYALYQGEEQAKAPVTLKAGKDTIATPVAGVKYSYKLEIYCKSASGNGPVQLSSVQVYGTPVQSAVEDPVFDVAAGSYYDPQTIHLSCATPDSVFYYTTDGTEPTRNSSLYYPQYGIYLSESATIKAIAFKNDLSDSSDVVTKDYQIAIAYASLTELVNQAGTPAGQKVVVTLTNETIDSLYVSSGTKTNGIYLTAAGRVVEIYCYNVPAEWKVGGTVSGTVKGEWKEWQGTWEVCPGSWEGITYQAPINVTVTVDAAANTYTIDGTEEGSYYFLMAGLTAKYDEDDFVTAFAENASWMEPGYGPAEWYEEGEMGVYSGNGTFSLSELYFDADSPEGEYRFAFQLVAMGSEAGVLVGDPIFVIFTYSHTTTGLENNVNVKAVKTVENGQMMIIKNGVKYNVMGKAL